MDTIWTPREEEESSDWMEKLTEVLSGERRSSFAGVAEWVDAVDLKSTG